MAELISTSLAERIVAGLQAYRFQLTNEKKLQAEMATALTGAGLIFKREVKLAPGSVIDFMIDGGVGIEVKIKGQRKAIYRQCERYCAFNEVRSLVLATNAAMGFPASVLGKPVYLLSLGRAWL